MSSNPFAADLPSEFQQPAPSGHIKSDGAGLSFMDVEIHRADDPFAEAAGWVEEAAGGRDVGGDLAVVFGLGLGWQFQAMRRRWPEMRFIVFEPSDDLFRHYRQHKAALEGEEPLIITDWREMENAVAAEVVYGGSPKPLLLISPGYKSLWPEASAAFEQFVMQEIMRRAVIDRTRTENGEQFLDNLAKNAGRLMELPDLMFLKGRLPGRPAFVAGSGPSLSQSAAELREVGQKGLIIAASSALKPLLAAGVAPQVVICLESSDTSDYITLSEAEKNILGPSCVLALAAGCHPAHFDVEGFHQAIFHLTPGEAQLLSEGPFLPQGGSAGTAAFSLAFLWGLRPLILVGQDQSYQGANLHAAGTVGGVVEEDRGQTIEVKSLDGGAVETHSGLLASLRWFGETAAIIKNGQNPPPLYNASAGGAVVPGFVEAPLAALVSSLPPVKDQIDLAGVLPRLPRPNREEVRGDVEQIAKLVTTLRRISRMDHRKAQSELKQIVGVSKFMAQLLMPALVAASKSEQLAALDKADGLMTQIQVSLG